jgi:hypothetical protein
MPQKAFNLALANFDTASLAGSNKKVRCTDMSFGLDVDQRRRMASSGVDPRQLWIAGYDPMVRIQSDMIKTLLDYTGVLIGATIDSDVTYPGAEFHLRQAEMQGTHETGSEHIQALIKSGVLVPRTIEATQNNPAQITCEALAIWDETNAPLAVSKDQAYSLTEPSFELYTLGPASINGSDLADIQGLTIDFGIEIRRVRAKGYPHATNWHVVRRMPEIRIPIEDADWLADLGISGVGPVGKAYTNGQFICYLRKCTQNSTVVADGTAEHIKFTIGANMIRVADLAAREGEAVQPGLVITPYYDGTNEQVQVATTSAIT